ncbi:hypothetical protein [Falsigemmobacter faecalis]|uniref:Uncharacterized protein n=1 Tax=Falsigemmobacter faecalis TaxID=2488730 RepID=A0A3P3DJM5_9RHOB|nr:hypothetical protein [Falsigemmobacter faecalis]RRH74480.1 hypothetical protein EG244_10370 [Falsigemmobacter faecalis]
MFAKALRGLRRLAIRFDAWMTEKPKPITAQEEDALRKQGLKFMAYQTHDACGGLRPAGKTRIHLFD